MVVEGCGAYVAGMSAKNYNSFPEAPEVGVIAVGVAHGDVVFEVGSVGVRPFLVAGSVAHYLGGTVGCMMAYGVVA